MVVYICDGLATHPGCTPPLTQCVRVVDCVLQVGQSRSWRVSGRVCEAPAGHLLLIYLHQSLAL